MDNKTTKKRKGTDCDRCENEQDFQFICPTCSHPILFHTSKQSTYVTKLKRWDKNILDTYFSLRKTIYPTSSTSNKKRKRKRIHIDIGRYLIEKDDDVPRWNAAFKKLKHLLNENTLWCLDNYGMLPQTKDELTKHWYRKGNTEEIIYTYYDTFFLPRIGEFEKFLNCNECSDTMFGAHWYLGDDNFGCCKCDSEETIHM